MNWDDGPIYDQYETYTELEDYNDIDILGYIVDEEKYDKNNTEIEETFKT